MFDDSSYYIRYQCSRLNGTEHYCCLKRGFPSWIALTRLVWRYVWCNKHIFFSRPLDRMDPIFTGLNLIFAIFPVLLMCSILWTLSIPGGCSTIFTSDWRNTYERHFKNHLSSKDPSGFLLLVILSVLLLKPSGGLFYSGRYLIGNAITIHIIA